MECEYNNNISNQQYHSATQPTTNLSQSQVPNGRTNIGMNGQNKDINQNNNISLYNANSSVNPNRYQCDNSQQGEINKNDTLQCNDLQECSKLPMNVDIQNVSSSINNQNNEGLRNQYSTTNTQTIIHPMNPINPMNPNQMDHHSIQTNNNNFHTVSASNTNNNQNMSNPMKSESSIVYKKHSIGNYENVSSTEDMNKTYPTNSTNNQSLNVNNGDITSYTNYASSNSNSTNVITTNNTHSGPVLSDPELHSIPQLLSSPITDPIIPSVLSSIPVNNNIPSLNSVNESTDFNCNNKYDNSHSSMNHNTNNNENINTETGVQQQKLCNSYENTSKTDSINNQNTNHPLLHPSINDSKDHEVFSVAKHLQDSGIDPNNLSQETKRDIIEIHEVYSPEALKKSNNTIHNENETSTMDSSMKLFPLSDILKCTNYIEYQSFINEKKSLSTVSKNKYVTLFKGSMLINNKQHNVFVYEVNSLIPIEYLNQIISGVEFQIKNKLPWNIYAFTNNDSNHLLYFIYINEHNYKSLYDIIKSQEDTNVRKEITNQLYEFITKLMSKKFLSVEISIYTMYFSFETKTLAIHDLGFTRYIDFENPNFTSISIYDYPIIYKHKKGLPVQYIYSFYLCIYQLYTHYSIIPFNASLTKVFEQIKKGDWIFEPQLCKDTKFYEIINSCYKSCTDDKLKIFMQNLDNSFS